MKNMSWKDILKYYGGPHAVAYRAEGRVAHIPVSDEGQKLLDAFEKPFKKILKLYEDELVPIMDEIWEALEDGEAPENYKEQWNETRRQVWDWNLHPLSKIMPWIIKKNFEVEE